MRRALWVIGILLGIGLIAAVVGRQVCRRSEPEEEEEKTEDSEKEEEAKVSSEEGEVAQETKTISESENSDPR